MTTTVALRTTTAPQVSCIEIGIRPEFVRLAPPGPGLLSAQVERIDGDNFEISAALGAGNSVAFFELVFIQIEIGVALRTQNHLPSSKNIPAAWPHTGGSEW